jgi:hypothetical protein
MSITVKKSKDEPAGFVIEIIDNCALLKPLPGRSTVPMLESTKAVGKLFSRSGKLGGPNGMKGVKMDLSLGHIHGAHYATGREEDLAALWKNPITAERAQARFEAERDAFGIPKIKIGPSLEHWLKFGRRGVSSNYMISRLIGAPGFSKDRDQRPFPSSPHSIMLCVQAFNTQSLDFDNLDLLKNDGAVWAMVAEAWPEIRAIYAESPESFCENPKIVALSEKLNAIKHQKADQTVVLETTGAEVTITRHRPR